MKFQEFEDPVGFVIIRHARTDTDDALGRCAHASIRKVYPNIRIVIVDDHSPLEPDGFEDDPWTDVIRSDFPPGVGEILAWYYVWSRRLFPLACVIHDSMAITTSLPPMSRSAPLWNFHGAHMLGNHGEQDVVSRLRVTTCWGDMVHNRDVWKGCFGLCATMSWSALDTLHCEFGIFERGFLESIRTRTDRMALERVFGWACWRTGIFGDYAHFGDIHTFPSAFYPSSDDEAVARLHDLVSRASLTQFHHPVVKVWRGR